MKKGESLHFFDAIDSNKRNSTILLIVMLFFSFFVLWISLSVFIHWIFSFFISLIVSILYIYLSYNNGLSLIMHISNAKRLDRREYPYLHHSVEGLSAAAGIPVPKVYIINDSSPNAFATGKDPKNSAIAVTRGLLTKLNNREIGGVVAHEISHIVNYDIKYVMIAIVVVGFISIVSSIFARLLMYSGKGSRKGSIYLLAIAVVLMVLAPVFTEVVRFALSRQREYLADANAARMTRDPKGLIGALKKISGSEGHVKSATGITAPLYFANPLKGKFSGLFASHPPIEKRMERLGKM